MVLNTINIYIITTHTEREEMKMMREVGSRESATQDFSLFKKPP